MFCQVYQGLGQKPQMFVDYQQQCLVFFHFFLLVSILSSLFLFSHYLTLQLYCLFINRTHIQKEHMPYNRYLSSAQAVNKLASTPASIGPVRNHFKICYEHRINNTFSNTHLLTISCECANKPIYIRASAEV